MYIENNASEYSLEYTKKIMENVCDILRSQEKSISELAHSLNLHRSTVHRYKKGERVISAYRVQQISEILNVDISSLLPTTSKKVEDSNE